MDIKLEYLQHLKHLRYDMTNEIPDRVIHSSEDQPMHYKVRKNWFVGVIADAANLVEERLVSQQSVEKFKEFFKFYKKVTINRLTTKEDIEKADRLLDSLIEDLEK